MNKDTIFNNMMIPFQDTIFSAIHISQDRISVNRNEKRESVIGNTALDFGSDEGEGRGRVIVCSYGSMHVMGEYCVNLRGIFDLCSTKDDFGHGRHTVPQCYFGVLRNSK